MKHPESSWRMRPEGDLGALLTGRWGCPSTGQPPPTNKIQASLGQLPKLSKDGTGGRRLYLQSLIAKKCSVRET